MVSDERAVNAAVKSAESVIFSRYDRSDLKDLDIAVSFEASTLEVDVYLNAPAAEDAETVADEAALAAREAVDTLLEG